MTINTAILGFSLSKSNNLTPQEINLLYFLGAILSVAWIISMVRGREIRNYIENRIERIEIHLNTYWEKEDFPALDIRHYRDWHSGMMKITIWNWPLSIFYNLFRSLPGSITNFLLPFTFCAIWGFKILF